MNERIRELAMQTDRECEHLGQSDIGEDWVAKFAELIVKDCIDIVDKHQAYEVMDDIIDHFGVEP